MPNKRSAAPQSQPVPEPSSVEIPPAEALAATNTMWEVTLRRGVVRQGIFVSDFEVKKMYYITKTKEQATIENEMAANMKRIVGELIARRRAAIGGEG